jgi:small-conductance mechanosensitive channel
MTEKLMPLAIFGIALLFSVAVRHLIFQIVKRRAPAHPTLGPIIIEAISFPSVLWCLAFSLEIAIRYAQLSERQIDLSEKLIVAFLIISITLAVASVTVRMLKFYGERNKMPFAVAGLSETLTRIVILSIGALILLGHFNISITPILTALGVGGLAVALALQDTLANLFAGVHILVENPIALGDYIKLSDSEEGVVTDIGWRTTRIRTGQNNTLVVPNTKITSGILTNFNLPGARVSADIAILATHEADVDLIAKLAMDTAAETAGVLEEPAPTVLFDPGILPTHMQLKLIVHVANQLERGGVQSALRVRLLKKMREHDVPLPVVRT